MQFPLTYYKNQNTNFPLYSLYPEVFLRIFLEFSFILFLILIFFGKKDKKYNIFYTKPNLIIIFLKKCFTI